MVSSHFVKGTPRVILVERVSAKPN